MDQRLNDLWKSGNYPFDQDSIISDGLVKISDLLGCLQSVIRYLENRFGKVILYRNHDWHQHDGYIMDSEVISWNQIKDDLKDEKALYDSRDEDDHVRIAIYPENLEFIIRYYVLEEDDDCQYPGIWGHFDITVDKEYFTDMESIIRQTGVKYLILRAKNYFDDSYAG